MRKETKKQLLEAVWDGILKDILEDNETILFDEIELTFSNNKINSNYFIKYDKINKYNVVVYKQDNACYIISPNNYLINWRLKEK